ncbi:MAG TPA: tetratricopeptide repeat protein [Casimicrobiaceae bacterium]|nr:tetratricopeptide repeat protein [Casimicrobiaceae bacterium]
MSRRRDSGARLSRASVALARFLGLAAIVMAIAASADPTDDYAEVMAADVDYVAGRQAIDRKDWNESTARLTRALVRHPDNADLHNYLGFAYRNLLQYERAFDHYKRAIAIDPRHRGAHEYIGEAYLLVGDLASAEKHLDALRSICLLPCEELSDLERAIAKYRAARSAPRAGS